MSLKKNLKILGIISFIFLTFYPAFRMGVFLLENGWDNISNDTLLYGPLWDQILNGKYIWKNLFRDTFLYGHSLLVPILSLLLFFSFFALKLYFILLIGLALSFLSLLLIFDSLVYKMTSRWKWVLLPILAFLFFSTSQISTYENEFSTFAEGFGILGISIGIWGLCRFPGRWFGIVLMVLGGILSSWSFGRGPMIWPCFLLGLILLDFRKITHYLAWLFGAGISSVPYLLYLIIDPIKSHNQGIISFFNFPLIIKSIGFPFLNNWAQDLPYLRGAIGLVLLILALGWLFSTRKREIIQRAVPALILIFFALLHMWQLGLSRQGLSPRYQRALMVFWIGLTGLFFIFVTSELIKEKSFNSKINFRFITCSVFGILYLGVLGYFYLSSNVSFEGKSFFLKYRTPAASSCLRNFDKAPTYCEPMLFCWELTQYYEFPELAGFFHKNKLNVFSHKQKWTLQGDFILENVQIKEHPKTPDIFWTQGLTNHPLPFSDYRKLNLFLHSPNSLEWTISIPRNIKNAELHSAVAISQSAPMDPKSDGVIFEISVTRKGRKNEIYFRKLVLPHERKWEPLKISLNKFAGEAIRIQFSSESRRNPDHDWAMYRFPYVQIDLDSGGSDKSDVKEKKLSFTPGNTEFNPRRPNLSPEGFNFNLNSAENWQTQGMIYTRIQNGGLTASISKNLPNMIYDFPLDLCLSEFSHLFLKISATSNIFSPIPLFLYRSARVHLQIDGQEGFQKEIWIPLLPDGKFHEYSYELKLLELHGNARLTGISLNPISGGVQNPDNQIRIADFGLVRNDSPGLCE